MQGLTCCWRGRIPPLLLLLAAVLPFANGSCEFPSAWTGQWFQSGKPSPITINATTFDDKSCIAKKDLDSFIVFEPSPENCYKCLIINDRHENVIQFREVGKCQLEFQSFDSVCEASVTDDSLFTMFRLNPKPIPCPFSGAPFTFTYNRGDKECSTPLSHAESCTDPSKLLLKYLACPDIDSSESTTEELQCLATWKDGRIKYLVGTLKLFGRNAATNEETFRCFLYEKGPHKDKATYELAQSGDSTCSALTSVSEGSRTIKLTKVDKEHNRCKYPSWVTKHHDWHSLDGTKDYHFTIGNATLRVSEKGHKEHEERIVCHNQVENHEGTRVKLVAHITSGCDIGYVCMIFHKRDKNVIEIQQSSQKTINPEEACHQEDLSNASYTTLITSTLETRKCPLPGRYRVVDYVSSHVLSTSSRRQRRDVKSQRAAEKMTWKDEENEDEEVEEACNASDIQIGCGSTDQSEMIISNTCEAGEIVYSCHDSWEEQGVWYTIVSQKTSQPTSDLSQTFCVSMRWVDPSPKLAGGRGARSEQQEQELWLSRPAREFQRGATDQWSYRLANHGICQDLTRASAASSSSLSRVSLVLSAGAAILCKLLSR